MDFKNALENYVVVPCISISISVTIQNVIRLISSSTLHHEIPRSAPSDAATVASRRVESRSSNSRFKIQVGNYFLSRLQFLVEIKFASASAESIFNAKKLEISEVAESHIGYHSCFRTQILIHSIHKIFSEDKIVDVNIVMPTGL